MWEKECVFLCTFGKRFPFCGVYHYESASEIVKAAIEREQ